MPNGQASPTTSARKTMYSSQRIRSATKGRSGLVECEIQLEYRDPRVAHEAQLRPLRKTRHQMANSVLFETARSRYPRNLQLGVSGTDVRVEPTARARNRVDGNDGVRWQSVAFAVILRQLLDALDKLRIGRAEISSTGRSAVVAGPGSRGARVKILRASEVLADQPGADDDAIARHKTTGGLARRKPQPESKKHQRKNASSEQRERNHADNRGPKMVTEGHSQAS